MTPRPPIPPEIKREVRQRCGFGCVICGVPLYEYDHMPGWDEKRGHIAAEITLLCRKHHGEKTSGLLPISKVELADQNPKNIQGGTSAPLSLHYDGNDARCIIGNNTVVFSSLLEESTFDPLVIDGEPIVRFRTEDGHLLLSLRAYYEDKIEIEISDNEIIYATNNWDVQLEVRNLIIRKKPRNIILDLEFRPPNSMKIKRGRIIYKNIEIIIGSDYLFCVNNANIMSGNTSRNLAVGFAFGEPAPPSAAFGIQGIHRSGFDRPEGLKFLRRTLKELRSRS